MPAIKLLVPEEELANIDRLRGGVPRERWIRELCAAAVEARDRFGGPCALVGRPLEEHPERPKLSEEANALQKPGTASLHVLDPSGARPEVGAADAEKPGSSEA